MKRERIIAFLLAGGVFLLPLVCAALSDDHPYKSIIARNSFALIPPPPPAPVNVAPPPSNVKLTGISTLWGDKKALLMVQDTSGPGKPDMSVILREGQRDGQIEVLEINVKLGSVKIKNAGTEALLTFDANGVKLPALPSATAAAPPPPNVLPIPGRPTTGPNASATLSAMPQPQPHGGLRQIPTRQLRQATETPAAAGASAAPQAPPAPAVSPEVQLILMEAQRGNGGPPMPPTIITPDPTAP